MYLSIEHQTNYRYARSVELGPHRLLIRPLEGHDVQIRSSSLLIEPGHKVRWIHDIFDNSIALVTFTEPAEQMRIVSRVTVEQYNTNPFDFVLEPSAVQLPFTYAAEEGVDVRAFVQADYPNDEPAVRKWIRPFLDVNGRARTMDFLTSLNKSFPLFFQYVRREELGIQSPGETLHKRSGSCRDFALLFMEAARCMGLAARFVTGYLCRTGETAPDPAHHSTHAWAQVYLPGAGWKGFDPTCGILAADLHVRTGVTRCPGQASPVSGTFVGQSQDFLGMEITVDAFVLPQNPPADAPPNNPASS